MYFVHVTPKTTHPRDGNRNTCGDSAVAGSMSSIKKMKRLNLNNFVLDLETHGLFTIDTLVRILANIDSFIQYNNYVIW